MTGMNPKVSLKILWGVLIIILCILMIWFIITPCLNRPLSFDEALVARFITNMKKEGYSWQLERQIGIIHDPLYFLFILVYDRLATFLFGGIPIELETRTLSVLFHILTSLFLYLIGKRYHYFIGIVSFTMYLVNPFAVAHSVDGYHESLQNLILSASLYFFLSFLTSKSRRSLISCFLSGGLSGLAFHIKNYLLLYYIMILLFIMKYGPEEKLEGNARKNSKILTAIIFLFASLTSVLATEWIVTGSPLTLLLCYEERIHFYIGIYGQTFSIFNISILGLLERLGFISFPFSFGAICILKKISIKDGTVKEMIFLLIVPAISYAMIFSILSVTRYLLCILPFITVSSSYAFFTFSNTLKKVLNLERKYKPIFSAAMLIILSFQNFSYLLRIPSVSIIDDRIYRKALRSASEIIRNLTVENGAYDTWVLTNTQHSVVSYYSGLHTRWFISFDVEGLLAYAMYDPYYEKPHISRFITPEEEQRMYYIVLEDYVYSSKDILFYIPYIGLRSDYNDFFLRYLSKYYVKICEFYEKGRTVLYQRVSSNTFLLQSKPTIYVGDVSAYYDYENYSDIFSLNGWICGGGWSYPITIKASDGNEIKVRKVWRPDFDYPATDFVITIPDSKSGAELQINYFDNTYGKVYLYTYTNVNKTELLKTWHLNCTQEFKTLGLTIDPSIYFDCSEYIPYHQQYFMILTEGCDGVCIFSFSLKRDIENVYR